jgi:hypothetical protein
MVPTWVWVVVLVAGSLAPFAGRAFHIDDPLFLWTARQVLAAPAHFYGFKLNWSGLEMQMTDVMCNPPGMAFFLAAAASVVGWREFALHAACLLPAIAAGLGVLQLARSFCSRPLFAVVLTVLTPGFLVCGTSVMCDVAMLACWVWALVLWERGLTSGRYGDFLGAGVLAALCGLMKYSGLSVVPLLLAWGAVRQRRLGRWAFALLIPVAMLGAYEALAYWAHGAFLFGNAAAYAREVRPFSLGELPDRLLIGLTFAGGCALPALALAPCVWSRRALAAGAALFLVILAGPRVFDAAQLALTGQGFGVQALWQNGWQTWKGIWPLETQRALWLMGGLSVGALACGRLGCWPSPACSIGRSTGAACCRCCRWWASCWRGGWKRAQRGVRARGGRCWRYAWDWRRWARLRWPKRTGGWRTLPGKQPGGWLQSTAGSGRRFGSWGIGGSSITCKAREPNRWICWGLPWRRETLSWSPPARRAGMIRRRRRPRWLRLCKWEGVHG